MEWIVLVASGMLEAVWATALSASKGFKKLWPSVVFVVS
ncbi:MAG: SMR family transporter, partial [Microbacterium gubbeenense]